jgi:hypothetical protein
MALKLAKQTQFGPMAENAYAKITNYHGTKDSVQVQVAIYYDEESRHANRSQIADGAHYISLADLPEGVAFIPAIYEVLKTMADYQGAEDC